MGKAYRMATLDKKSVKYGRQNERELYLFLRSLSESNRDSSVQTFEKRSQYQTMTTHLSSLCKPLQQKDKGRRPERAKTRLFERFFYVALSSYISGI